MSEISDNETMVKYHAFVLFCVFLNSFRTHCCCMPCFLFVSKFRLGTTVFALVQFQFRSSLRGKRLEHSLEYIHFLLKLYEPNHYAGFLLRQHYKGNIY